MDSSVIALDRPFDYAIPVRLRGRVMEGSVVRCVLHGRRMRAFVTDLVAEPAVEHPRALSGLVSAEPMFTHREIELARWTARRYVVSLGAMLHSVVPGRFSAPAGRARGGERPSRAPRPGWLEGRPGAGTTVVVVPSTGSEPALVAHLVGEAVADGGQALVVCGRVAVAQRIAAAIPEAACLHAEQTPGERAAVWAGARDGRIAVVVGTRSALFVPLPHLRLVVVASAHEESLKAERAPRLDGGIVARQRAAMAGVPCVVSSPAPPLELATAIGSVLVASARGPVRPEIGRPYPTPVTDRLLEVVAGATQRGSDALVFCARRGEALRVRCGDCGWYPRCEDCGVGLGSRRAAEGARLTCRLCGRVREVPEICESCGGALDPRGWGDERVARALAATDLGAKVVRVSAGETLGERPRPAVVVGTLAALHALRRPVGAVGVADLDQLLGRTDFRAAERALQVLHELAGVLEPGGRFLVQTREREHHTVQAFTRRSFTYFLDRELDARRDAGYPPFGAVVRVEVSPGDREALTAALPPTARAVGGIARGGRVSVLVRAPELDVLLDPLKAFVAGHPRARVDVDPFEIS